MTDQFEQDLVYLDELSTVVADRLLLSRHLLYLADSPTVYDKLVADLSPAAHRACFGSWETAA